MNEEHSSVAAAILANYVRPVKRPKRYNGRSNSTSYSPLNKSQLIQRFLWNVDPKENGCWHWTGSRMTVGYGQLTLQNEHQYAHRLSHELFIGPIPDGFFVCHKCDVRHCVNPDHLFAGTQLDNIEDMDRKGRRVITPHIGELNGCSKLKESDILLMREMYSQGHLSQAALGRLHGVSQATVWKILNRKNWAHI